MNLLPHGLGQLTKTNSKSKGYFKQGKAQGLVLTEYDDGSWIAAYAKSGLENPENFGRHRTAKGASYVGYYKNSKTDFGRHLTDEGGQYTGFWENDTLQGYAEVRDKAQRCEAFYSNGKRLGFSKCLSNGWSYKGFVKENEFHGFGVATNYRGQDFAGTFERGKFVKGKKIHSDGWVIVEGHFKDFRLTRSAKYTEQASFIQKMKQGEASLLRAKSQFDSRLRALEERTLKFDLELNALRAAQIPATPPPPSTSKEPKTGVSDVKPSPPKAKPENRSSDPVEQRRLDEPKLQESDEMISAASGSGFFVSTDGHLITNNHVIEHCSQIKLKVNNSLIDALVVARDEVNDLALLKTKTDKSIPIPMSRANPELLEDIYAAGFPFGDAINSAVKVTKGIVSSLSGMSNNFSNVQIDAALQPGNSGGPIVDGYGNAVAVAVSKLDMKNVIRTYGVIPENTNFGVKATVVNNLLEAHGVKTATPGSNLLSGAELGRRITSSTVHLSCLMTIAQIQEAKEKKVLFTDFD